ncbi:hypothetical protein SH584_05930 [Sphingomonas sp. LY29]|uniref:hypothetical protein n=1 Tax=Sphingomonas sp. LY29 TaxID=3095341 RepID=UPI002D77D7E0|nr:hypothetical protein [Sphingomonas sp. LY29]WRP26959.1 hypothetical protein SH584_05930 [Sphingomonas sp. LY29]
MEEGSLWPIATIVGPIILLVAFVWVILRNRQAKTPRDVTERATHDLYQAEDRDAKAAERRNEDI